MTARTHPLDAPRVAGHVSGLPPCARTGLQTARVSGPSVKRNACVVSAAFLDTHSVTIDIGNVLCESSGRRHTGIAMISDLYAPWTAHRKSLRRGQGLGYKHARPLTRSPALVTLFVAQLEETMAQQTGGNRVSENHSSGLGDSQSIAARIRRVQELMSNRRESVSNEVEPIQAFGNFKNFGNFSRTWDSFTNWGNR